MRVWKVWLISVVVLGIAALGGALAGWKHLNRYQTTGVLTLPGLSAPVTVQRDARGVPYITASNLLDALRAQGFVHAQDRLFSLELTRRMTQGRICELVGARAKGLDIRMRAIGLHHQARRHAARLDQAALDCLEAYVGGINAYIKTRTATHPLEFTLAGLRPQPWEPADSLAVLYYMGWTTSANLASELVGQMLVDKLGLAKAREIFPLNLYGEVGGGPPTSSPAPKAAAPLGLAQDPALLAWLEPQPLRLGSNNWAVNGPKSPGPLPILAGDTHLDVRVLPGPWHACGLITPQVRAVGVIIPGIPGLVAGRTQYLAASMTNSYVDMQDLYIETLDPKDPDRYMEGQTSLPLEIRKETLSIQDSKAPGGQRREEVLIKSTRRGPLVSGLFSGAEGKRVLSLRWAPYERMKPDLDILGLLRAQTAPELAKRMQSLTMMGLNFLLADTQGNIVWQTTGCLPIRGRGQGVLPHPVTDGKDNWQGWVSPRKMPRALNPASGWLATANHRTVGPEFPFYYSNYAASSYRYRRLRQVLSQPGPLPASGHWALQRDTLNLLAQELAPILAKGLAAAPDTAPLGRILAAWNHQDQAHLAGPTVFHEVYGQLARLVFSDELGPQTSQAMLGLWYFWQERLQAMVQAGASPWFDDVTTKDKKETLADLILRAGRAALARLSPILGPDPAAWAWGRVHTLELVSPLRRSGPGKSLLGSGPLAMGGSGETLLRGLYDFNQPYGVRIAAALRMVVDLSDLDKVLAVAPGGQVDRMGHPHNQDQVADFMSGEPAYWWFSQSAIDRHCREVLTLKP